MVKINILLDKKRIGGTCCFCLDHDTLYLLGLGASFCFGAGLS